ncbi:carbonic anhydrase [Granulicella mallensis]|uniref:Carbonic anhydrase n=1 Tax=Granulicella mallensis (strain ATCC BAA-1857 / DSM 23137 / MP5ACTX8) TaxID=682795 RepID=G8NV73_GRAMM|nr:carbonic anhydrase [Granulicella mallensis]AEU35362.1 Carbonate dehydratase [Granulicella mallensis MP5ACTX8]
MDEVLEQLKKGVRRFRSEVYPNQAHLHAQAAINEQRPHTLFIACADSRVNPNELTHSAMGEVFVTRNIGNMVPAYGEMLGGVSAVIEYAVTSLRVRHIVVCGHSDCGAMKALLNPDSVKEMPTVKSWLTNARAALTVAETMHTKTEWRRELLSVLTEQNVLLQLQHLKTHPSVAGAMAMGELTVSGWLYDIGKGQVSIAKDGERGFTVVE